MAEVILYCYDGDPPPNEGLLQRLGITDHEDYTYIVATVAQAKLREELAPPHQLADGKPQMVFHRFLRHQLNQKLLTRAEERVALLRAAQTIARDPEVALELKSDIYSWRDALAELAQRGHDLSQGISPELQNLLVNYSVGQLLQSFQTMYRAMQQKYGMQTFEEAAYELLLKHNYQPTSHVIMEGFTFLTPLQQRFIDECEWCHCAIGKRVERVHLIIPYKDAQAYGFEIVQRTYDKKKIRELIANPPTVLHTPTLVRPENLNKLREGLFADGSVQAGVPEEVPSVTLESYSHRNREVAACIERIKAYLQNGVKPQDIAIVTTFRREFDELLQEEVKLHDLRDSQSQKVSLGIQPRQLLLTPVGRFVLELYNIWKERSLQMDAEQFEAILASGWLGAHVQATTEKFNALKFQMFARCQTRSSWQSSLRDLRDLKQKLPQDSRLPAASADENTITLWERAIAKLEDICRKLFSVGEQTIGKHVEYLLDQLNNLAPEEMLKAEREILERIRVVLCELAESASLSISPDEFGNILNSLVQERTSEKQEEQDEPDKPGQIWATTPQGIDGCQKNIVFFLGVDNQRVPCQYPEPWPFYNIEIDEHQEKERYFFLTAVRSANKYLHLSYAKADEEQKYRASPYMEEAASVLGIEIDDKSDLQEINELEDLPSPKRPLSQARRLRYELSEIAHFALCPFRYKLERLDFRARQYRDKFQMRFLAQGEWLNLILDHLVQQKTNATDMDNVHKMFLEAMNATKNKVKTTFPGLRDLDWVTVDRYIERDIKKDAKFYGDGDYSVSVESVRPATYIVTNEDRTVQVEVNVRYAIRKGRLLKPYINDLMREEWLIPPPKPEKKNPEYIEVEGVKVFASHYDAAQWWQEATKTAFNYKLSRNQNNDYAGLQQEKYQKQQEKIGEFIKAIEAGYYPKHIGEHCYYCPVRGDCLGLLEEENP